MNSVIQMRATFFRNVKDYKFSHKLTAEQKQEIINSVGSVLGDNFKLIYLNNTDEQVRDYLNEHSLINNGSHTIFLHKQKPICIDLFNGEHLSVISSGVEFFKNANNIVDLLKNKISLAYSDDYGYICSNLNNIGAGIKLECDICFDSICGINKLEQVKQNISMLGYLMSQTNIKNIFRISTKCSLGFGEGEIYNNFLKTIQKLQDLEIESAKMLDVTNHDEILDNVFRSNAILNSAHLMNADELTRHLIILRTGLNLGYICLEESKLSKLQQLANKKLGVILTKEERINLAKQVKTVLKGE